MAETRTQRRLAAILAADVVGYSRLMGADEVGTLALLKSRRKSVLEPLVDRHQGRVFKTTGDGVLVEFGSAVNALECAVELQRQMEAANGDLAEDRRVRLRIGVNLGDVLVEGNDLYGEGVNVAARLEPLAEPGGICISEAVMAQVRGRVAVRFEDMGEQNLKNIAAPVRIHAVRTDGPAPAAAATPGLSDKPAIAVLPFENLSGDAEQQYFSDGITEDLITELSRFHRFLVVARNSSFQYRGKAIDVKRVGRELGAAYLVEGSVRKAGTRVRITAQLIDVASGNHIWAERYDREIEDIFAIQDEVVTTIVGRLAGQVDRAGFETARRKRTESMAAYDYLLRGLELLRRAEHEDIEQARRLFESAIALDPNFAQAHAALSLMLTIEYWDSAYSNPLAAKALDRALVAATRAVALDENDAYCHRALAHVHHCRRSFDLADYHLDLAARLNPHEFELIAYRSWFETCAGRPDAALTWLDQAARLDPRLSIWYWELRGLALYHLRRYPEAAAAFERCGTGPAFFDRFRAAAYAQAGQLDAARAEAAKALERDPDFTLTKFTKVEPYQSKASLEHMIEGMRKAGLPE
jgi:adenylate cyclase